MRYLTWLLLSGLVAGAALAETKQLKSFDELMTALKKGEHVTAVFHYGSCKLLEDSVEVEAPDAIGGMSLLPFEYFAPEAVGNPRAFVTVSETRLISHRRYGYVLNYVKLRVYEDNEVEITARYLDPKTYDVKMDETFTCGINTGRDKGAVYFYLEK